MIKMRIFLIQVRFTNNVLFIKRFILARGLCGIEFVPFNSDKLPDGKVYKVMKAAIFVKSKTLYNPESVQEHITTHCENENAKSK